MWYEWITSTYLNRLCIGRFRCLREVQDRPRTNWRSTVNKDLLRMGITWEEVEVAAQSRSKWRRSVTQCFHLDAGWVKVKVAAYQPGRHAVILKLTILILVGLMMTNVFYEEYYNEIKWNSNNVGSSFCRAAWHYATSHRSCCAHLGEAGSTWRNHCQRAACCLMIAAAHFCE